MLDFSGAIVAFTIIAVLVGISIGAVIFLLLPYLFHHLHLLWV